MTVDEPVVPQKPQNTPEWVFPWRGRRQPLFPRVAALIFAVSGFAFLITMVRVRLEPPVRSSQRGAALLHLNDDARGRALTLRAQEGGPFPSRFAFTQWRGLVDLEAAGMAAAQFQRPQYVPQLQELSRPAGVVPLELAARAVGFFPQRTAAPVVIPDSGKWKLAPQLYPLSGITAGGLPDPLPAFDGVVDGPMASASWRFLVRLGAAGDVAECLSLEKGGEIGATELETWLHKIRFQPESAQPIRWISVAVIFRNQLVDGSNSR